MGSKVCFSLSVSGAKIPPTRRHDALVRVVRVCPRRTIVSAVASAPAPPHALSSNGPSGRRSASWFEIRTQRDARVPPAAPRPGGATARGPAPDALCSDAAHLQRRARQWPTPADTQHDVGAIQPANSETLSPVCRDGAGAPKQNMAKPPQRPSRFRNSLHPTYEPAIWLRRAWQFLRLATVCLAARSHEVQSCPARSERPSRGWDGSRLLASVSARAGTPVRVKSAP
jgi:hypothetical protein